MCVNSFRPRTRIGNSSTHGTVTPVSDGDHRGSLPMSSVVSGYLSIDTGMMVVFFGALSRECGIM